jgi:hypothetical protein
MDLDYRTVLVESLLGWLRGRECVVFWPSSDYQEIESLRHWPQGYRAFICHSPNDVLDIVMRWPENHESK